MAKSFVIELSISLVQVGFVGVGEDADRAWHECDLDPRGVF
jgi:hypothetical protein